MYWKPFRIPFRNGCFPMPVLGRRRKCETRPRWHPQSLVLKKKDSWYYIEEFCSLCCKEVTHGWAAWGRIAESWDVWWWWGRPGLRSLPLWLSRDFPLRKSRLSYVSGRVGRNPSQKTLRRRRLRFRLRSSGTKGWRHWCRIPGGVLMTSTPLRQSESGSTLGRSSDTLPASLQDRV